MRKNPASHAEIEDLLRDCISYCPFCGARGMTIVWSETVPKQMTCDNCGACWEPIMNVDDTRWSVFGVKLVRESEDGKGKNLLNRLYPSDFWESMVRNYSLTEGNEGKESPEGSSKTVVIREVVKIRCRYCGNLYNEVEDTCPHCGGKR